jgi:hypothetical protein
MIHRHDPDTCEDAAERVLPVLSDLQGRVLNAFRRFDAQHCGSGATDGEIEALPEFRACRPTSVRKRRLEIERLGYIRRTDVRRKGMIVFRPVSLDELAAGIRRRREGRLFP